VKIVDDFLSMIFVPEFKENDPFLGGGVVTEGLLLKSLLGG